MARGIETTVLALLAALKVPRLVVLLEFPDLNLYVTNWPRTITVSGQVYQGAKDGVHKVSIQVQGVGENLEFSGPAATITIDCLDAYFQAMSYADNFRDTRCTMKIVYNDGTNTMLNVGWSTSFRCDADSSDANKVTIRLAASDAVQGQEVPRRTTQEQGCQNDYMGADCGFRFVAGMPSTFLLCNKSYTDCKDRFPQVTDPVTGQKVDQPKPYSAYPGDLDHGVVAGGR